MEDRRHGHGSAGNGIHGLLTSCWIATPSFLGLAMTTRRWIIEVDASSPAAAPLKRRLRPDAGSLATRLPAPRDSRWLAAGAMAPVPPLLPLFRDQRAVDARHLKLLGIFHFVRAGMSLFGLGMIALHFVVMRTVFTNPQFIEGMRGQPVGDFFMPVMMVFYGIFGAWTVLGLAANIAAGICLLQRRARIFCLVVAGFNCLSVPLGTVLGVFTFIVLLRDSVRELYAVPRV
jgi:hypothetical protein